MSGKTILLLLVAVAVAAVTAIMVRGRIETAEVTAPVTVSEAKKVLVTKSEIKPGSFIRADSDLTWVDFPATTIQPSYVVQGVRTAEEFNGAVVRRTMSPGEPVTDSVLVKTSEGGFMSAVLSPGTRAVTISVNPTSGNAGFVFPGDRVDLIVTHNVSVPGEDDQKESLIASETFIENVRVLAVDQMLDNPDNKAVLAKTVTLEVTPKQAEIINVAADLGKISVSLRSLASKVIAVDKTPDPVSEENADTSETTATPDEGMVDPFFPGEKVEGGPEEGYSSASDVSKLMELGGGNSAWVNVIRGNELKRMQFYQGAGQ